MSKKYCLVGALLILILLSLVIRNFSTPVQASAIYLPTFFPTEIQVIDTVGFPTALFPTPISTSTLESSPVTFTMPGIDSETIKVIFLSEEEVKLIVSQSVDGSVDVQVYTGADPVVSSSNWGPPCVSGSTFSNTGYIFSFEPRYHPGYDGSCTGGLIGATADGVVYKYYPYLAPSQNESATLWSSGMTYVVKHNISGVICYSIYGHMKEGYKQAGDIVSAGDALGVMGSTGLSTGPHLHFGIACETGGPGSFQWFDPVSFSGVLGSRP